MMVRGFGLVGGSWMIAVSLVYFSDVQGLTKRIFFFFWELLRLRQGYPLSFLLFVIFGEVLRLKNTR